MPPSGLELFAQRFLRTMHYSAGCQVSAHSRTQITDGSEAHIPLAQHANIANPYSHSPHVI